MTLKEILAEFMKSVKEERASRGYADIDATLIPVLDIREDPKFKAYKVFKYIIMYVQHKARLPFITVQVTERCISEENKNFIIKSMEKDIIHSLFSSMNSECYDQLVEGTYFKVWN